MTACCRLSAARALRWAVVLWLGALLLAAPGCGSGGGAPEGQSAIENVAKWYQKYRAVHRGRPPSDEGAFIEYIESELKARGGETIDRDEFLTSPRDGQKYVIQYGKVISNNPERNVAVYESEGYDGKKLVAFEFAGSREVDEEELQSLLAGPR